MLSPAVDKSFCPQQQPTITWKLTFCHNKPSMLAGSLPSCQHCNLDPMASSLEGGLVVACAHAAAHVALVRSICLMHPRDTWMPQQCWETVQVHHTILPMPPIVLEHCNHHRDCWMQTNHTSAGLSKAPMQYHTCPCNTNSTVPLPHGWNKENVWAIGSFHWQTTLW